MDNEKLDKAQSLREKIKELNKKLEHIKEVVKASLIRPENCGAGTYLRNSNQNIVVIDQDILDIALTIQEKRIVQELEKIEKEFEAL